MDGKIISSQRNVYVVYCNGVTYNVFPRGVLRFKNEHLDVGDNVTLDDESSRIINVSPRSNELIRPKCSNIDQIFVTMSVAEPELSPELLYKFLTYINMHSIKAIVVLTKIDLIDDLTKVNLLAKDLEKLGVKVFMLSKNKFDTIEEIKTILKGKTSIFMGQTGVGKSSLINLLDPSFDRKIGEYSQALGRGKHQTKEVILLPYENGFIGDTPGFSSLDLGVYKEDIAQFFPGYNEIYTECFFSNCLHQNEKGCKIKQEIETGHLSKEGYEIYLKLLNELPYKKERFN